MIEVYDHCKGTSYPRLYHLPHHGLAASDARRGPTRIASFQPDPKGSCRPGLRLDHKLPMALLVLGLQGWASATTHAPCPTARHAIALGPKNSQKKKTHDKHICKQLPVSGAPKSINIVLAQTNLEGDSSDSYGGAAQDFAEMNNRTIASLN